MSGFSILNRIVFILGVCVLFACQQPGQLSLTTTEVSSSAKATDFADPAPTGEPTNADNTDGNGPAPAPAPEPSPAPAPAPSPGRSHASRDDSGLVECQLGRPNVKVTLSSDLESGSNASSNRLCMSENACLNLINAYANVRGCSLDKGAPSGSAQSADPCTEIFPGSKGTCRHATILTDDEISVLLDQMGK